MSLAVHCAAPEQGCGRHLRQTALSNPPARLQVTPDHHFVLDRHPSHSNIIIGAGFSGHGFKFGPVVGKVLCELSLGLLPSHDLSPFKIQRFQNRSKPRL
ncbi:hypothetical protein JZ751_010780 [Albula glossodonta]|uniref:FAD dependent oxidoreductase domain-containing protein n=1 Tax=Albula glossodonta TaxID=121402 RepID=A0A8T2MZA7_9TELE|nr:hypothetical protein JZ751_010780 [Albula glossodonta]